MPQILSYSGAKVYDTWNADDLQKVGDLLDDINGTKNTSNTRIFDRLLQTSNTQILALQSQLSDLVQNNYIIHCVNLIKDTTITTNSSYTGSNVAISNLQENFLYVLSFDTINTGSIQININGFGYTSSYKVDSGVLTEFQDNDIKAGIFYLFIVKNNQFIFVGENNEQRFENLSGDISLINQNISLIDPRSKKVDAYLAANHDLTGFVEPATYTPISDSDNSLSAFEKIVAQQNQQDSDISTLEQRVDSLYGAVIYLGTVDSLMADITQTILTDKATEILTDRGMSTTLKQGYTLVDLDSNDWWYDEADALWVNIGYSAIATATNSSKGVVMGGTSPGDINVDANGKMSVGVIPVEKGGSGITSNPSMLTNLTSVNADTLFKASPRPGVTGVLPIANGGSGLTASPSIQINLASASAANVMQASPRPGVTGVLPAGYGGTGFTSLAALKNALFTNRLVRWGGLWSGNSTSGTIPLSGWPFTPNVNQQFLFYASIGGFYDVGLGVIGGEFRINGLYLYADGHAIIQTFTGSINAAGNTLTIMSLVRRTSNVAMDSWGSGVPAIQRFGIFIVD